MAAMLSSPALYVRLFHAVPYIKTLLFCCELGTDPVFSDKQPCASWGVPEDVSVENMRIGFAQYGLEVLHLKRDYVATKERSVPWMRCDEKEKW